MIESVPDFVIPLERDNLLQERPGIYSVKHLFPLKDMKDVIAATKSHFGAQGPSFIIEHFDEFFSLLVHGSNVKLPIFITAFERIHKCLDMFVSELEKQFERNKEPTAEDKPRVVTITKMLVYLLGSLIRHIELSLFNDIAMPQAKGKKGADKLDPQSQWQADIDNILVLVYQWISLPLEKLWNPPIPDGVFVMTIGDICFRILERCKAAKDKSIRESIFQILGVLTKKYNYSMSCVVKLVQLIKMCDGLAPHLAVGVVELIEGTGSTGIMKEIMREIEKAKPEEGGTRNIALFLEKLTSLNPKLILPALGTLTNYLEEECHIMRHCVLGILGIVVKDVLASEDLSDEDKALRNKCLDYLMMHMTDGNMHARSKTVQVWQNLCSEGAVPISTQIQLIEVAVFRINDKSVIVRRNGFSLLRTLLQSNPFAASLNHEDWIKKHAEAETKLNTLKRKCASISEPNAQVRKEIWCHLLPTIRKDVASVSLKQNSKRNREENTDLGVQYEAVRQLILNEKIPEALQLLIKTNSQLPEQPSLNSMNNEARIEYLISLLYKVFIDSQEVVEDAEKENRDGNERNREKEQRETEYNTQLTLVKYIEHTVKFTTVLATAIPKAVLRLDSAVPSDAIEACSFLGLAYQFEVKGAKEGMRRALSQAFYPDPSVVENLAEVYKDLYISTNKHYKSERHQAVTVVQTLIDLFKSLESGESPALAKLLKSWRMKGVLGNDVLQVMWEIFSRKLSDRSPLDSRAALSLLTIIADEEHMIMTENLKVLITVGLGPWAQEDLLFARDVCRALTRVKIENSNPLVCPARLTSDHEIFEKITSLLITKFPVLKETCYTTFAFDAINAIYHFADKPESLMQMLLTKLQTYFCSSQGPKGKRKIRVSLLINMFDIIGHIAIKHLVHLDVTVYKELKRRNALREATQQKKSNKHNSSLRKSALNRTSRIEVEVETPSSASHSRRNKLNATIEDSGEEVLEGAVADDADAEFIQNILENEVVTGTGMLVKYIPLLKNVCQHPEIYKSEELQIAATLALCKMMTVSSIFCRENMQLLITILERSPYPSNRENILVGLTDMMGRFPNVIEPWTQHFYGRLRDNSAAVRRACVQMLSSLIMREMVRVKGQVSELAICLIDPEKDIQDDVTKFFNELASKGNSLYNIVPDILSRLTDRNIDLEEEKFQRIISCILKLLQKEKQIDSIIERICARFSLATSERQWRDLSYCLSLLKFNVKGIRRLTDNLGLLKEVIHHAPVLKVLQDIINQAKKKPETKTACIELEEKLDQMLTIVENNQEMPPPQAPPKSQPRVQKLRRSRRTATPRKLNVSTRE